MTTGGRPKAERSYMAFLKSQEKTRRDGGGGGRARWERKQSAGGGVATWFPSTRFMHMCARARTCENELSGEVIHCSAETNARVHALRRAAALSSGSTCAKRTIVT